MVTTNEMPLVQNLVLREVLRLWKACEKQRCWLEARIVAGSIITLTAEVVVGLGKGQECFIGGALFILHSNYFL